MMPRTVLHRWRQRRVERAAARAKYEVIIYFDGPRTKWPRSSADWQYEQHPGGLRIPLPSLKPMPEPHADDILQRKHFRFELLARAYVIGRLTGWDHTKVVGEIRQR